MNTKICPMIAALLATVCLNAVEVPPPAEDGVGAAPAAVKADREGLVEYEYILTANGLPIRQAIIDDNEYNRKKYGEVPEIKYITIHNTAEPYTAMQERTRVNLRTSSVTSFQFAVDEREAVQILPDNTHAWHAGDGHGEGNMASIGMEICRSMCINKEDALYKASEENAARLTAYLLKKYNLTVDDLRRHYDWSGKHCPHRILDADSWDDFKARVAAYLENEDGVGRRVVCLAPSTNAYDEGCVNISKNRDGVVIYNTQYGVDFTDVPTLVEDLEKRGIDTIIISSWILDFDLDPLFKALAAKNIAVEACYVPKHNVPDWIRRNTVTESEE